MKLLIWAVMACAVCAGAYVNAQFWGASLPALAVLFFAIDLIKPFLFAAGRMFRLVACAAMLISATASTMFISNLVGGAMGVADRVEDRLAIIDGELAELRGGANTESFAAALSVAQADERAARDVVVGAEAGIERAEMELRLAEDRLEAAATAVADPEACGPPEAPSEIGPTCRKRRRAHRAAMDVVAEARSGLSDAEDERLRAARDLARAERVTAQAASAVVEAGDAADRDSARIAALEAERKELGVRLDAEDDASGLETIAAWIKLSPADFSAAIAVAAGVVAELFCTIGPAGLVAQIGAPNLRSQRLRATMSGPLAEAEKIPAEAPRETREPTLAEPRGRAVKTPAKIAHGGARYSKADRSTLTKRARGLIQRGASKAEAARMLGVSPSTMKRWLSESLLLRRSSETGESAA